jgi:uncharacterized protein
MKLCDVNVLIYAHRADSTAEHLAYASWLKGLVAEPAYFALSEAVLSGFVRVVTNPRVFREPTPVSEALDFCLRLRERSNARVLRPGPSNWEIFSNLCQTVPATGKLVADAWHAALAIEYGCEWISTDADFARFPDLKWRHPLQNNA